MRGWHNQSWRHSLAAKGVRTSYARKGWFGDKDVMKWDPVAGRYKSFLHQQAALGKPVKPFLPTEKKGADLGQIYSPLDAQQELSFEQEQNLQAPPMTTAPLPRFTDQEIYVPESNPQEEMMDKQQAQPVEGQPPISEEPPRLFSNMTTENLSAITADVPQLEDLEQKETQLDQQTSGPVRAEVLDLGE